MPTHSSRNSGRAAATAGRALLLAALCAGAAQAHEAGADALPDTPGWQLGGAAAVLLPSADERWPVAAWPGVLVNGSAPRDARGGLRLEHGTLDLAARIDGRFGLRLAAGWHDREPVHTEAATLEARTAWGADELTLRLGRDTVQLGDVIDGAGHLDRFSQPPLAKRAVLNDAWIDDGLSLAWRRPGADGLRALAAGVWRGRAFPGGPAGPAVPSLHLHAGWGHLDGHLSAAHFEPQGRGAAAQSLGATGHLHGSLDCRASLQQRVCFDGTVDLLAGSLQWSPEHGRWRASVAGLLRREQGALYASAGDAALRTRLSGLWADLAWTPAPRWTLATRLERLVASNQLAGIGTALLADAAGLSGAAPVQRLTAALLYQVQAPLTLSVEAGQERRADGRVSHLALRAVWRNPRWLGGSW